MNDLGPYELRRFLILDLIRIRDEEGRIPQCRVEAAAIAAEVSVRSIWRWVEQGGPPRPGTRTDERLSLTNELRELYYEMHGNVSKVHRKLVERHGEEVLSRRTLARRFLQMLPADRAYARDGTRARLPHDIGFTITTEHRNSVWQTDHTKLDIEVIPVMGNAPVRPWLTIFIDDFSRAVMGYSVNERPTSADIIAAFHSAIRMDEAESPLGGVPDGVDHDQGRDFLAKALTEVAVNVGCRLRPLPAYSPHLKGKVERFNGTLREMLLRGEVGFTGGPRGKNGALLGPSHRIGIRELVARVDEFVRYYNAEHRHSTIQQTPIEKWLSDPTPVRTYSDEDLAWMARPSKEAVVRTGAIRHDSTRFMHDALRARSGERLTFRYMPHDNRSIDVFDDHGVFICTATAEDQLTEGQMADLISTRAEDRREAAKVKRRVTRRQTVRHAPATAPGDIAVSTRINAEAARGEESRRNDRGLHRAADADILNLGGINRPVEDAA